MLRPPRALKIEPMVPLLVPRLTGWVSPPVSCRLCCQLLYITLKAAQDGQGHGKPKCPVQQDIMHVDR